MEQLANAGLFSPPMLSSIEAVLESGIAMKRGRVFVDLWDAQQFAGCRSCVDARIGRLDRMNLHQSIEPTIECADC